MFIFNKWWSRFRDWLWLQGNSDLLLSQKITTFFEMQNNISLIFSRKSKYYGIIFLDFTSEEVMTNDYLQIFVTELLRRVGLNREDYGDIHIDDKNESTKIIRIYELDDGSEEVPIDLYINCKSSLKRKKVK